MPNELVARPLSILDTAGEAVKALTKRKVAFAPQNGGINYSNPTFLPNGLINGGMAIGANGIDYTAPVGDPLTNRVVRACVNAKATAMASAPAILEKLEGGQWKQVDHECVNLLNTPNDYHSYYDLQYATTAAEDTTGQAYWRLEFTRGGIPGEIWVEHPSKFAVEGERDEFISGYRFTGETGVTELEDREVIHFRRALDLLNTRHGTTPLQAGHPQVHGDNNAAIYQSAITDNAGVMSLLIALREAQVAQQGVVTGQIQEMVEALKRKLRGRGAASIVGLNLPVDVHKMGYSPDEMAISELIRYFTVSICALLETDPIIIHMAAGKDAPTYANFKEATEDFWSRTIVPTNTRRDAVLRVQYLPLWGLDPAQYRVSRDYSGVPAMQEDKDALHQRYREDYKAGAFDLWQYQTYLGLQPDESMKGKFYQPAPKPGVGDGQDMPTDANAPAAKSFNPNEPRDKDGKWAIGGGSGSSSSGARKGDMRAATADERKALGIPPAYTDVMITDDPHADLRATAKSSKGKVQYYYSPEYSQKQAAAKFDRVKEVHQALPAMREKWNAEIAARGPNAHEAMALRLISQTGFRVGGLEGGGDVAAYGASSLLTSHAKVTGDRIEFDFKGKGGHTQQHSLIDPVLAAHIKKRQSEGKETIFDTNDAKVRDYLKKTGGDFKVHDLRTRTASAMAAHYVGTIDKKGKTPRSEKQYKAAKNAIADKVAKKLGDTRSVVLSSYIAPQIWQEWESHL